MLVARRRSRPRTTTAPGSSGDSDAALEKAARYLVSKQSADGAWRSETYGAMRDGPSLTPLVMSALLFLPQAGAEGQAALGKGADYLAGFVGDDGKLKVGPANCSFPSIPAAIGQPGAACWSSAARAMSAPNRHGWPTSAAGNSTSRWAGSPADPEYGGWGYALDVPRKPAAGSPRNSCTNRTWRPRCLPWPRCGRPRCRPPIRPMPRRWGSSKRCQNFSDDPAAADPKFDDGGFFFIPGDAAQNKAGPAGVDRFGHVRFHSYGTMTADGLRALLRCGLAEDHPRVVAARSWLAQNFSAAHNPGGFAGDRAVLQDAT